MKRLLAVFLFCLSFAVHADQVLFQPGSAQGKDMWLSSSYNQTAVDDDKLQVGGWGDWYRSFIQFDLSGLPQTATSATMWMYAVPRGDLSTPVSMNLYLLTTAWNEQTQNYYTPLYAYSLGTVPAPTPNSWYGLTITGIYNGWKNGTYVNDGFVFLPTGNNNQFSVFRSSDYSDAKYRPILVVDYSGANLRFPLQYNNWTPYTALIASVFDHQMVTPYSTTEPMSVVAYTGEKGNYIQYGNTGCVSQTSQQPFIVNGNYVGATSCGGVYYLSYNNHPGFDYPVAVETSVFATANGIIDGNSDGTFDCPSNGSPCTGYGRIGIRHPNGYSSWYLHFSKQVGGLQKGSSVNKGQLIGYSGQTSPVYVGPHLHFEVRKNNATFYGLPVDPYGWKGEWSTDPYRVDGKDNVCLWETCQWW